MKDFKPIRDNIKRLIRKHGFKYLTFSENHLNVKYNTFDRHLRYGRIQLKHVYIMMELLNCDFYTLIGEQAASVQTDLQNIDINSYAETVRPPVHDQTPNEDITENEPANLDFLFNKI